MTKVTPCALDSTDNADASRDQEDTSQLNGRCEGR